MPTKYFENFPRVDYDIEQNKRPKTVIDILRRVGIRGDFVKLLPTYYKQVITNEERPDMLSFDHYGNTYYHWVEMFLNGVVDPYHDWVIKYQDLEQFINKKYPDRTLLLVPTHFSDSSYGSVDASAIRFFVEGETVDEYESNGTKLDATGTVTSFEASKMQLNVNTTTPTLWSTDKFVKGADSGAVGKILSTSNQRDSVHHYENSDGIEVGRTASGATAVTNAEYELKNNDSKREILVLRERYLNQFENELKGILKSAN